MIHKNEQLFYFRKLTILDIPQIKECLQDVINTLTDNEIFLYPSIEFMNQIIEGLGLSVGVFEDQCLIGFCSAIYPHENERNLGYKLDMKRDQLNRVVHIENICVMQKYRMKGLAKRLYNYLFSLFDSKHSIVLATISPKNIPSLSLAFSYRLEIVKFFNIHNVDRYIMYRDISKSKNHIPHQFLRINYNDIDHIQQALQLGYSGISFDDNVSSIFFEKN
nr:GNAT family N-acetyltransferase [uncultured Ruminococcus sp.]